MIVCCFFCVFFSPSFSLKQTHALVHSHAVSVSGSLFFFFLSWDIGVAGMKIGERRRLVLPSKVAYGAAGAQPVIPPHADLVFEVELVKVNNKTK